MSGGLEINRLKEDDVVKLLCTNTHIGAKNIETQMEQYIYKVRKDGTPLIHLGKTWEKLLLAARAIVAITNHSDVCCISSHTLGQRACLKYAHYTGATPVAGRFTPGTFTNQIQAAFREPRLLIVCDPNHDHQPIIESSYVNIPVIAFCNTDANLRFIDIVIPCNTENDRSIGLMWYLLAREVLRLRGQLAAEAPWEDVMVDLFFMRNLEAEAQAEAEAAKQQEQLTQAVAPIPTMGTVQPADENWGDEKITDWAEPVPSATYGGGGGGMQPASADWSMTEGGEWGSVEPQTTTQPQQPAPSTQPAGTAQVTGTAGEWGGTMEQWT